MLIDRQITEIDRWTESEKYSQSVREKDSKTDTGRRTDRQTDTQPHQTECRVVLAVSHQEAALLQTDGGIFATKMMVAAGFGFGTAEERRRIQNEEEPPAPPTLNAPHLPHQAEVNCESVLRSTAI